MQRIYTPPSTQQYTSQTSGRRSASPRGTRLQYHRRTPSFRDDGTVVQSIEHADDTYDSPRILQSPGGLAQRRDALKGQEYTSGQLIDLTSSAQKATERIRLDSSPPASPFAPRDRRAVELVDEYGANAPPRRQIIELNGQMPPPTAYGSERPYVIRQRPSQVHPSSASQEMIYAPDESQYVPSERYISRERPVDPRLADRPLQYVPQRAPVAVEDGYYVIDDDHSRRVPVQYATQPVPSTSRYIVLDHPQSTGGLDRTYDTRQQAPYRTTYVQQ